MDSDHPVGVQSVVYADRDLEGTLAELARTDVGHLELWDGHLSATDDEETVRAGLDAIADAGVEVCGYGVVDVGAPDRARPHVAFADRLGADYVTVNYPPDRDDVTAALCDAAAAFGVDVAVHNYSTVHHDDLSAVFSSAADAEAVLERHDHPRLGVCVDTGHFLVMDQLPDEVLPALGEYVVAVHLKDASEAEREDVPVPADLDLRSTLELFDRHADLEVPLVIEHELPDEGTTAALREVLSEVRAALEEPPLR